MVEGRKRVMGGKKDRKRQKLDRPEEMSGEIETLR